MRVKESDNGRSNETVIVGILDFDNFCKTKAKQVQRNTNPNLI